MAMVSRRLAGHDDVGKEPELTPSYGGAWPVQGRLTPGKAG